MPNKFRNMFADDPKNEDAILDLKKPYFSGDGQHAAASQKYVAVPLAAAGGPIHVFPLDFVGRIKPTRQHLNTHKLKVLDLEFCPYNSSVLATASEDCHCHVVEIPDDLNFRADGYKPMAVLEGHGKKVAFVRWNRHVEGLIATASYDRTVKVWDAFSGECLYTYDKITDNVHDIQWSLCGSKLAVSAKSSKRNTEIHVFDPRDMDNAISFTSFPSSKTSKIFWKDATHIGAFGFSKDAKRSFHYFDITNTEKHLVHKEKLDANSSTIFPKYDEDTDLLFWWAGGDGSVFLGSVLAKGTLKQYGCPYRSSDPQKGGCFIPKRAVNVTKCEIQRFLKLTNNSLLPIKLINQRKSELFQADCFPETYSGVTETDIEKYQTGEIVPAKTMSLDPAQRGEVVEKKIEKKKTYRELQKECEDLRARNKELEEKLAALTQ